MVAGSSAKRKCAGIRMFPGLVFDKRPMTPAERIAGKRHLRRGQILSALREQPKSRSEIADELGFNQRSVSLVVDEMVRDGLVTEQEGRKTDSGRRPIPVSLNPSAACVLGIDAGRTTITAMVADLLGREIASTSSELSAKAAVHETAAEVRSFVLGFLKQRGADLPPLAGVGLATEGIIYKQAFQHDYAEAAEPVRLALEKALGVPVIVDGDSRFTALGEQWFGQARGHRDVAVFNISEGLGMACIINGELLAGARGWAGEIGHVPLGDRGIECHCGSVSCLENVASGSGLARLAVLEGVLPASGASSSRLAAVARDGSGAARRIFGRFAERLALGAAITVDLYNPEAVVLGGLVSREHDLFFPRFLRELEKLAVPRIYQSTKVLISNLHENAVMLGACAKVFNNIYHTAGLSIAELL